MVALRKKAKQEDGGGAEPKKTVSSLKKRAGGGRISATTSRFVLFLGDDGVILIFLQGNKVVRRMFAPSVEKEHVQPFIELMQGHPKAPLYVLVDVIDQSYVRHTLPPVSPLGVGKLVQRRIDRDFAPEDINGALSLGREKTGRKEWNFLLISLANSALLQQWLEVLMELPNRFMGLYLAPVEAQAYLQELSASVSAGADASAWKILVTHNKVSGYRQVVLKDGQLVFTRLTQATGDGAPQVAAGNVEQEVLNTIEYLRRLSYTEQAGLDVYVIVAQEIKDYIDVTKFRATRANVFTPYEVSQLLDTPQAALSSDRFGDVVLGSSFGLRRKSLLKLNSAFGRKLDKLYQARLGVRLLGAGIAALLLFMTVGDIFSIGGVGAHIDQMQDQKQQVAAEKDKVKTDEEKLGKDYQQVVNLMELYKVSGLEHMDPLAVVRKLDPLLPPGVLVRNYHWSLQQKSDASSPAPTPLAEGQEMPYVLTVEIEFNQHGGDRDKLAADAKELLHQFKGAFKAFDVHDEKMPGAQGADTQVSVNFNDPSVKDKTLKEGENLMVLVISGPKAEGVPTAGGI